MKCLGCVLWMLLWVGVGYFFVVRGEYIGLLFLLNDLQVIDEGSKSFDATTCL